MATEIIRQEQQNVPPAEEPEPEGAMMGFFEHIDELRNRIFKATLAIAVCFFIALFFTNPVISYLKESYGDQLTVLRPTDSMVQFFRVTLMLAAILASPVITYQLLMFIFPGLTDKEKRWILMALPATTVLFLFGVAFTMGVLVPAYVIFLKGFQADLFKVQWTADEYIGFVTGVLFWHGVAFEAPVVFYVLARLGLITAKSMIKYWRHAVVGSSIFAAFIAPTVDPVTMIVIVLILMTLYVFSIALVAIAAKLSPINAT